MCGIVGFVGARDDAREVLQAMMDLIAHRGPDGQGQFLEGPVALGQRRLSIIDLEGGRQPMYNEDENLVVVFNGEIYNFQSLTEELRAAGHTFATRSDTEVLLNACIAWGDGAAQRLEGIFAFAFWDGGRRRLMCCRDRFGVKPFFYAWKDGALVFASELKALFQYPGLEPRLGRQGLCEVLGIGPARTAGAGVFEGVRELKGGCQLTAGPEGLQIRRYWALESRPHEDGYEETVEKVRHLLEGAIRRQLVSDVPLCTFLSGGLDSSIITAVAARAYQEQGREPLETYSFDYVGNRKHFKASAFQPDADAPWVKKAVRALGTRHRVLRCDIPSLLQLLPEAVEAKDLPGMADVDSSLLYFCRKVAERHTVALCGEFADEVIGGHPWFERSELLEADTFPWCPDLEFRRAVVKPELWESLQVEDYVQARYQQSLAEMPALPGEALWERRRREVGWLSLNWFMSTLLDRKDRMSMAAGLEVRVPFCDHHLVEYVWNIPWAMKAMNGQRKQVLRDAAEGLLPEELLRRPKSPYPKTHDPLYEQLVRARLLTILDDRDAPIHSLVDEKALRAGLLSDAGDYGKPWFGQLMAGPQMLAYLIQINEWMSRYQLTV